MSSEAPDTNDSIWDMSLFVERQVAQAFACGNCGNIPRKCINDGDGKIYCEFCVSQLKMNNTRANSAIDKIIDGLKVKCTNINTKIHDKDVDTNDDDDTKWDSSSDHSKRKTCAWSGTLNEWKQHSSAQCPFATVRCKYCKKYESMRFVMLSQHESQCDEVALMCELGCGQQFFRKEMEAHLSNDCVEQTVSCSQCNRQDVKRKELESHLENECSERAVVCKYAAYGCEKAEAIRCSLLDEHYAECAVYHLELKMESMMRSMEKKLATASKSIEHLKYRNCKLQMQIHQKHALKDDFFIIFESNENKNSFVCGINFSYNSSVQNMHMVKSLNPRKDIIIYKRVKDTSYCFAANVLIDKIIGITTKSKQQHIASCVSAMSNCICTFNVMYRVGGDSMNQTENHNICNILGTDVVFTLPQLLIARFNHRVIYSSIHGILCVGGEPIRKEDARRELEAVDKENEKGKKKTDKEKKNRKAILASVEQLNLAPTPALTHYYNVRNMNIKKDEEKLQMPPEPELKWRNLGAPMKYRRDCPSVGLWKGGNRHEEQLFVAGGWNEKDLAHVEMYNFRSREWKQCASLNVKRNSAGICEWKEKNNNMILVGGWNKKTTTSVEEYDAHKNQWYVLKPTNHPHKYYPACQVYHDLNPFINSGYGVIVVAGNDGRMYGDDYMKKQQHLMKQKDKHLDEPKNIVKQSNANDIQKNTVKQDWGFIEFYDPRDWIRRWTVIDNLPSFFNFTDDQCKQLYFQSIVSCPHSINTSQ
eukprot:33790_1